jgi:hypothetical protein
MFSQKFRYWPLSIPLKHQWSLLVLPLVPFELRRFHSSIKFPMVTGDINVGSILPFIQIKYDFDDGMTHIMGEAFDAACKELHDAGQPAIVHEIIAKRIIDAAKKGERDPVRLRDIGLAGLRKADR